MKSSFRNPYAVLATRRGGAGPHRDRRAPRGGARNDQADLLEEFFDENEITNSSHDDELVIKL